MYACTHTHTHTRVDHAAERVHGEAWALVKLRSTATLAKGKIFKYYYYFVRTILLVLGLKFQNECKNDLKIFIKILKM